MWYTRRTAARANLGTYLDQSSVRVQERTAMKIEPVYTPIGSELKRILGSSLYGSGSELYRNMSPSLYAR